MIRSRTFASRCVLTLTALLAGVAAAQTQPSGAPSGGMPPAPGGTRVALILVDQAGLQPPEEQAIRGLAETELTSEGFSVVTDPRFDLRAPVDASTVQLAQSEGAARVFVLEARGRLGQKIPMTAEELQPDGTPVAGSVASMTGALDEADTVVPRMMRATVGRQSAASTAEIDSVSEAESKPFQKKPGEKFWVLGIQIPFYKGTGSSSIYGYSLGYMYEADVWKIGGTVEGGGNDGLNEVFTGIEGAWIPLKGEVSPYIGGGIGFEGTTGNSGVGLKFGAGVEAFRLHGVRALAGIDLHVPLFDDGHQRVYPSLGIRFAF